MAMLKQLRHVNIIICLAFEKDRNNGDEPDEEQEKIVTRVDGIFHSEIPNMCIYFWLFVAAFRVHHFLHI